jgi:hypothetical protein
VPDDNKEADTFAPRMSKASITLVKKLLTFLSIHTKILFALTAISSRCSMPPPRISRSARRIGCSENFFLPL